jgi:Clp amino terminal domain, pathogenicity island component
MPGLRQVSPDQENTIMAYRGEDLDLRTPQTWSVTPPDLGGGSETYPLNGSRGRAGTYGRPAPILVDDTVLASSNHAFDVALAHRAGEVRLEHLLHAMTRIDTASAALEARGIRVAGLRRESATIIASEIPAGLGNGQGRPRRSEVFETVLRIASSIAYRRNAPANVDDVLDAMLDMPSDAPGIALLARHGGRMARDRDGLRETLPQLMPLPPLTRSQPSYPTEPRYSEVPERERIRKPAGSYYVPDTPRAPRIDLVGSATDGIQNARIDQLETAVRTLTSELGNERNALSGMVADLQRGLKAERDDTSRFRGSLHDRLQSLEQTVMTSRGDDVAGQIHDRLQSLEYVVRDSRKDDGQSGLLVDRLQSIEMALEQRLAEMARPWSVLSDRLQALEQAVMDTRSKGGDLVPLQDRLVMIERALRDSTGDSGRTLAALTDRMKQMERAIDAATAKSPDLSPIAHRLDVIEEALLGQDGSQGTDRLLARLGTLEEAVIAQRSQTMEARQGLSAEIKGLAAALAQQSAGSERVQSFISDRMQTLSSGFERQRTEVIGPLTERMNQIGSAVDGRLRLLTDGLERQHTEVSTPLLERVSAIQSDTQRLAQAMGERIGALETKLALSVQRTSEAQAAHANELREVHEALIKLNTNQHTLAGSIDQWRLDGMGDVSVIANRLEGLEKSTTRPMQMIEQLSVSVDNINRATVERYHRRNRFWYWLFGTDDWLTASWPSQVASVEAERQALRGTVPGATGGQAWQPWWT